MPMIKELNISWDGKVRSRIVGGDSLADVAGLLAQEPEVYVVYDKQAVWVAAEVLSAVPAQPGQVRAAMGLETSEERKCMDTVMALERWLLEAGASRQALILAIGGGITTDMAGFAAALYKRGIRYANLPTTLLAQVDAAIGGKTGVNLEAYKNMLGAFLQPQFTFLSADVLRTLAPRDFRSGLAEMAKTFLLADKEAYERFFASAQNDKGFAGEISPFIWRAAEIKAGIVARDPYEKGERALLNLGHSYGHAIEHEARLRGDDITHGEAVAMGIILAAELSEQLGVAQKGLAARLRANFMGIGLPAECPYPIEQLQAALRKDKKVQSSGKIRFVLLKDIGEPLIRELEI